MTAAGPCGPASRRGGSRTILLLELQIFHPLPSTVGHNLYPLLFNEAGTLLTLVPALLLREVQGMVRMLPASSFWFFGMAARLTAPASTIFTIQPSDMAALPILNQGHQHGQTKRSARAPDLGDQHLGQRGFLVELSAYRLWPGRSPSRGRRERAQKSPKKFRGAAGFCPLIRDKGTFSPAPASQARATAMAPARPWLLRK